MQWNPAPKIVNWHASPRNEAGVAYFLVESIRGFEEWEFMDWICFACVMKVHELQNEYVDLEEEDASRSPEYEQRIEKIVTKESIPTTVTCTSEGISKSAKSVRFGENDVFQTVEETEPLVIEEKISLLESWKIGIRKLWKRFKASVRSLLIKVEGPVISTLMRWGY